MARVFVGMGSNLGDRRLQLQKACDACRVLPATTVVRTSSIYETSAVGIQDQPRFLNAVIELTTSFDPHGLLEQLQRIENGLGRTHTIRWGPRRIDLDILLYDDVVLVSNELTIPHPRMTERKFVLMPLVELDPAVLHPLVHERVDDLLSRCGSAEQIVKYPLSNFNK